MRLIPVEVQEATKRWSEDQPLREVHELLAAVGDSLLVRAALAEAYVKGQAEMIPELKSMRAEITKLHGKLGVRPKFSSRDERAKIEKLFRTFRRDHPEWKVTKIAREIAETFESRPDWRTMRDRLVELRLVRRNPGPSLAMGLTPATPLSMWILQGV